MKDKIIPIDGGRTPNLSAEATRQLKANLPELIDQMILLAQLHRVKYESLIQNGFTETQALELCKTLF